MRGSFTLGADLYLTTGFICMILKLNRALHPDNDLIGKLSKVTQTKKLLSYTQLRPCQNSIKRNYYYNLQVK